MNNRSECGHCGEAFANQIELMHHIKEVHVNKRRQDYQIPPETAKKADTAKEDAQKAPTPVIEPPAAPVELPKPDPIVLEYKYKGMCPICRNHVKTITVKGGKIIVAWCQGCDKQLTEREVIPIDKQIDRLAEEEAIDEDSFPINKFKRK